MNKIYLTKDGYDKLVEELEYLKNVKRREITKALEHARSLGDLKENAEYHAAKEAMSLNEAKVQSLEDKLARTEIIDDTKIAQDAAYIGAKLKLKDLTNDIEMEYTLVDPAEANAMDGLISIASPVGKSLLGHKEGEIIEINVPSGILRYKIIKISR